MNYYTTATSIVKTDSNGKVIWQFTGEQVDEMISDFSRMENLLVDLVQPEQNAEEPAEQVDCEHLSTYVESKRFEYCTDCDMLMAELD